MPLTILSAGQQEQVHIQAKVQVYERKHEVCTRVIAETTLRIYFPGIPNTDSMISASAPERSTITTSIGQDEATITQGPPLILFAYSPSLPMMFITNLSGDILK